MSTPIVVVYQQLAAVNVTVTIPDLEAVIIGPAYDILDYPEDAANILLSSAYGTPDAGAGNSTFDAYVPPVGGDDAVTVLPGAYPLQSSGSLVDHDSVVMYLKYPRVVLGSTNASVTPQLGTSVKTDATDQTLIELVGMIGTGFVGAGVRPGDRIVLTSSYGAVEQTVVRTVASVGEPNGSGLVPSGNEKYLRISQNLPAAGTTSDDWTYAVSGAHLRVERSLPIQMLVDGGSYVTFPEPGTDKLVLKGGVELSVALTPVPTVAVTAPATTTATRSLSYAELYLSYRALRQDLTDARQFTTSDIVVSGGIGSVNGVGKIDARNPLAVAIDVALKNAGTASVYGLGVPSDDAAGHAVARAALSHRRDLYAFTVLTQDLDIITAYRNEAVAMADPNQALADGVPMKFRMILGSVPLPEATTISEGSISGVSQQVTGANSGRTATLVLANGSTDDIAATDVLPGDTLTIGLVPPSISAWSGRRGTHRVSHVNTSKNFPNPGDPTSIEIEPGSSRWNLGLVAGSGDIELLIRAPDGTVKLSSLARVVVTQNTSQVRYSMKVPTVVGGPYTVRYLIVAGLASVEVGLAGFAVTISVNGTSHTANDVVTAINAHPSVSALMLAEIVANGGSIINGLVPGTDPVSGQAGTAATVSAVVGTTATITGLLGMTLSSVGRYLTLSAAAVLGNNGTFEIIEFVSATSVKIRNAAANAVDGNNGTIDWVEQYPYQGVSPITGACTATVVANDDLYNRLEDTTATFISSGVRVGDVIEIPVDPNDYTGSAFGGRTLSYVVSSVISENRLLINPGTDDTAALAKELPHGFLRDLPNRYLDNTAPAAISYRVRRTLSLEDRILDLAGVSQGLRTGRCVLTWPDRVKVSDLRDGSLPRAVASVRELASWVPGFYFTAAVAGAIAGLPAQHGLSGLGFAGISELQHSTGYFDEKQLVRISEAGFFVAIKKTPSASPTCLHQLTTDPTTLQSGEVSIVKNVDFISKFFIALLEPFLIGYNVTQETLNSMREAVETGRDDLVGRTLAKVGPPLISGELTSIAQSDTDASRVDLYFNGKIPAPLNTIAFRLVL